MTVVTLNIILIVKLIVDEEEEWEEEQVEEIEEEHVEEESILTEYDDTEFVSGAVTSLDSTLPIDLFEFEYPYQHAIVLNLFYLPLLANLSKIITIIFFPGESDSFLG